MSAYVLLKLLNELGKKIRCEAMPSILIVSPTCLKNSINQEYEIQDSVYHMTLIYHLAKALVLIMGSQVDNAG